MNISTDNILPALYELEKESMAIDHDDFSRVLEAIDEVRKAAQDMNESPDIGFCDHNDRLQDASDYISCALGALDSVEHVDTGSVTHSLENLKEQIDLLINTHRFMH